MRLLILTAWNEAFRRQGELCMDMISQYVERTGCDFTFKIIPDDYPRKPSWFKVPLILENLQYADHILWIDSDAMLVDHGNLTDIIHNHTLNISKDENGINCGIQCWKNDLQSKVALDRIESSYEKFKDHPWFEQASLMEFVEELDVFYQPKEVFNAYTSDFCPQTRIVHFPGFTPEEKLILMQAVKIGVTRNGHGESVIHA